MAGRNHKKSLDWFKLDVNMDVDVELLEAEYGLKGFAVFIKLLQLIYGSEGYYCKWSDEVELLFSRKIGEGRNFVSEILSAALKRGLFDNALFERYSILTSKGIQKRYFEITSRRVNAEVEKQYLLIEVDRFFDDADRNSIYADRNSIYADINCTREETDKNKSKSKSESVHHTHDGHRYGKYNNVDLSDEEYTDLRTRHPKHYLSKIERLSRYLNQHPKKHYKNHHDVILDWIDEDLKKAAPDDCGMDEGKLAEYEAMLAEDERWLLSYSEGKEEE